jgi:hypothetical protein
MYMSMVILEFDTPGGSEGKGWTTRVSLSPDWPCIFLEPLCYDPRDISDLDWTEDNPEASIFFHCLRVSAYVLVRKY